MATQEHKKIAQMDWDAFEDRLQTASRGATRGPSSDQALRDYFGDDEYEYLKKLAQHSQQMRQSRAPIMGNVVLINGIMGAALSTVDIQNNDEDLVWLNYFRLPFGSVGRLRLKADGSDDELVYKIKIGDIDKRTYSRAVLWLRARWRVEPFGFDWRKDIDLSAKALAQFINEKFKGEPVHLVAHSMGGLVCRNFIRLYKNLWNKMQD